MTIENARALQEQLVNKARVQQKNRNKELADDAERYRLFDTAHALAAVYLPPDWLGSEPIVS